ncbi:MAG: hypothetical protein COA53_11000 [Rhodobacteraceae bacterium]|nr:MAG: hypothetical protein COA53_11000 [Paracoccaceae bacterium]
MKTSRLFLIVALLMSSVSTASAYTEEQLRSGLKLFLSLQGFECGNILNVDQREEPRAFDILCADNDDGSGEETMYFFQFVGAGAVVKIIE